MIPRECKRLAEVDFPLEALRLGCEAFASDLNPVACLILKIMLEDIPRHGSELADELRKAGTEIKQRAEAELADLYPADPDGATPIAYLWARTVRCEAPDCGAEIPLMRSFWLFRKAKRRRALRHAVERRDGAPPQVTFEVFEPKADSEVRGGTVTRAKATCLCCGTVLPPERVRLQLAVERGGADVKFDDGCRVGGARMTAVVTLRPDVKGRYYRLPTDVDYAAVREAQARVDRMLGEWERGGKQGLCPIPNEPTPAGGGSGAGRAFSVQRYGMLQWGDLFTARSTDDTRAEGRVYAPREAEPGGLVVQDAPTVAVRDDQPDEEIAKATAKGFHLPFDVVRRFSQPLGIDLDRWTDRIIAQKKGVVRLLPIAERAKTQFGSDGAAATWIDSAPDTDDQPMLFPEMEAAPETGPVGRSTGDAPAVEAILESPDTTALDRVHAAMLLQAGGHANALRTLILWEQDRSPDFLRLSNALSALYPRGSREKRLVDAMLLAVPR